MPRLPSPAMVVALIALAVALGGTSWAVVSLPRNSVGSKQIHAGGVRASDVRTGAIGTRQVRDGSLRLGDLAPGTIPNLSPSPPGKAPDSDLLDGKDSAAFLAAGAAAVDAEKLGGRPPSDFLAADGKAADADKLDGLDSADIGVGWFTGRIIDLPVVGGAGLAGAASGISQGIQIASLAADHDRRTLSPDREIRARDWRVRLSAPSIGSRQIALSLNSATISGPILSCSVPAGGNECSAAGPSFVVPASSPIWVFVGGSGAEPAGNDVSFSWRSTAP